MSQLDGEYGDHLVVMREIGVYRAVQRESLWRCVEGSVRLGVVADRHSRQPSKELVHISNSLNSAESFSVAEKGGANAVHVVLLVWYVRACPWIAVFLREAEIDDLNSCQEPTRAE